MEGLRYSRAMQLRGDYVGGRFLPPDGDVLRSFDPSTGAKVGETASSTDRITLACITAAEAWRAWRRLGLDERWRILARFRESLSRHKEALADGIVREIGKVRPEARTEIDALVARFDFVRMQVDRDLKGGVVDGFPSERLAWRAHGVVGVVGPFNFPLHLCHAHVVPALLLGNCVVIKPSEVALLTAERYAEAADEAGFPPGVFNLVHGSGAAGAALLSQPTLRAVAFTGSWATGRRIREALLDRPEVLAALEMGGKNTCVVLEDADLRQAAHEVAVGGYLTTGQRCTCTDRVLVHAKVMDRFVDALRGVVDALAFDHPDAVGAFAGPLATAKGQGAFLRSLAVAESAGADRVAVGRAPTGGNFVPATLHVLPTGLHDIPGFTDQELFGPGLHVEAVSDDAEAFDVLARSPYGFATSVFTADSDRFETYLDEVETGILNWNRSTNQASPRLPFSGLKKSGNHRPAGAFAPRNLAVPVAIQLREPGGLIPRKEIEPALPAVDLDHLEAQHEQEERREADRTILDAPRHSTVRRPMGGTLYESHRWLERLYAGDRFVREKKRAVFDHVRSAGPWFVSVDDEPLCLLDGMSQTATLPAGFAADEVVKAYLDGEFGSAIATAWEPGTEPYEETTEALATALRAFVPGLSHVAFVNSGAESCEKALALCHAQYPSRRRVLAFEGSFHGRTLLALAASFSPSKREPYEFRGHEVVFAPFPVWWRPSHEEPRVPRGWLDRVLDGEFREAEELAGEDCLLVEETHSLRAVHQALTSGDFFAVVIEPMQSEGGDRYATPRFHRALRLMTRRLDVPLVVDEVQTGFGLGGRFAWHTEFDYRDESGAPDAPDCVTFAKRAQIGIVVSRFADPSPTSTHAASVVRGRIHAQLIQDSLASAAAVERHVAEALQSLTRSFPNLVLRARNRGYAVAFDLPSPELLKAYLAQRLWRGVMVFGAGTSTVRYRLSRAYDPESIDRLFRSARETLAWLVAHPGVTQVPSWVDLPPAQSLGRERTAPDATEEGAAPRVRVPDPRESSRLLDDIVAAEAEVYEPARRSPREELALAFENDGVAVVAEVNESGKSRVVGCALAAPLESFGHVAGPDLDPLRGTGTCLYALAVTVDPDFRGQGLGRKLKVALLKEAAQRKRSDGSRRFLQIAGRNRLGAADPMIRLNRSLGAFELRRIPLAYSDGGEALYYRQPVGAFVPREIEDPYRGDGRDFAHGVAQPLVRAPHSLVTAARTGRLYGPSVNKITVMNYVTPDYVRALEWIGAFDPRLPHLYLTSSRDELFDKTVRLLRTKRPEAQIAIGLDGGYVGHTTAAARSMSDPATHRQGPAYFDAWPRVPHPVGGARATLGAIRDQIDRAGGPDGVLGLFVEPVQERTGRVLPSEFFDQVLPEVRALGVPIVFAETASAAYRTGAGPFFETAFRPDVRFWWAGGQVGFIHVATEHRVAKPLTLVSTWDGDELSLVRVHHQLRAIRRLDRAVSIGRLSEALAPAAQAGFHVGGMGLYRTVTGVPDPAGFARRQAERGLRVGALPNRVLVFAPAWDVDADAYQELRASWKDVG